MEDIGVHLESVTRRYRELDEKFAAKGGLKLLQPLWPDRRSPGPDQHQRTRLARQ